MWRTKQIGLQELICLVCVGQVVFTQILESTYMIERVVPDAVSPFNNHAEYLGVFAHIIAYHKEGGFYLPIKRAYRRRNRSRKAGIPV